MIRVLLRAVRLYQWPKNFLLFVPLLAAHRGDEFSVLRDALMAFFSFSFLASSLYVVNDLLDLESDRLHPTKRERPFASKELSTRSAWWIVPALLAGTVLGASTLPGAFVQLLFLYGVIVFLYSLFLKQIAVLDVLILAGLYILRIFAGGAATGIEISEWMTAFALFFFLSLAFQKRYTELISLEPQFKGAKRLKPWRREYKIEDLPILGILGAASGYLAVMVLALYVTSDAVVALYPRPKVLWFLCPLFLYWFTRIWILVHRREMHDDPIVFALTDRATYVVAFLVAVIVYLSSL